MNTYSLSQRSALLILVMALACALVAGCAGIGRGSQPQSVQTIEVGQTGHIGKWFGIDQFGERGSFQFSDDGSGYMTHGGRKILFTYRFDYAQDPIWLDLTLEGGEIAACIVGFSDLNTMLVFTQMSATRPESFPPAGSPETVVLQRVMVDEELIELRDKGQNPIQF